MDVQRKLEILADAAKYDASCASSGSEQRDSRDGKGMGSTAPGMGICHSYAPDGRCISLLKVLLTNACHLRLSLLRQPHSPATCRGRASRSTRS